VPNGEFTFKDVDIKVDSSPYLELPPSWRTILKDLPLDSLSREEMLDLAYIMAMYSNTAQTTTACSKNYAAVGALYTNSYEKITLFIRRLEK
jgi:hypothetical protein